MPTNHEPIAPERQRAFKHAAGAAMALCRGHDRRPSRFLAVTDHLEDPCVVERVRRLVVAMGVARDTPGGLTIADIARLGYVVTRPPSFPPTGG